MTFTRVVEDFTCGKCGREVAGNGYTNHCPACLTSRHVDEKGPGDRAATCGGLMPAVAIETEKGETVIVQRCERCGITRRCRRAAKDSDEAVLAVARRFAAGAR